MDTTNTQKRIIANKIAKGFPIDNLEQEFLLLHGEVTEAYAEVLKGNKKALGEELADIAIYLLGISEIEGINLGEEIERKLTINENRVYIKNEQGAFRKITRVYKDGADIGKVLGMIHANSDGFLNKDELIAVISRYDEDARSIAEPMDNKVAQKYEPNISILIYKTVDGSYDILALSEDELQEQARIQK